MACDVRIAAEAAVFGQPEIKLGIIPGFGGTQRLPRLVGPDKALEMNLVGDAVLSEEALELGLVNRVVPDHELFETALMWGRKLAAQAPVALGQIKQVSHKGDLDDGIEAEKAGLRLGLRQRGRQRGHRRLPRQAHPEMERQVDSDGNGGATRGADPRVALHRRADRGGDLGPLGDPRLPHPGDRALGQRRPDGGRPHRRLRTRPGALLVLLPAPLPVARRQTAQPRPRGAGRARAPRPDRGRDHPEHRPPAPGRRLRERRRGARLDRDLLLSPLRRLVRDRAGRRALRRRRGRPLPDLRRRGQTGRDPLRRAAPRERRWPGPATSPSGRS